MHNFVTKGTLGLLALVFGSLLAVSGCQGDPETQARAAELADLPGLKVTISGVALDQTKAAAIARHIEGKAIDTGAALVRMKKDDQGGSSLEIALHAKTLPDSDSLAADLVAAFPELAGATIDTAPAADGGPEMPVVEVSDDLTPEEAKQEITQQLQAEGVEGDIDVQVEDGEGGRRIEVKVERSIVE